MSLFQTIATACRPELSPSLKLYAFSKEGVPLNKEELEKAEIETELATSFDEVFRKRPDLASWYLVKVIKNIGE